MSTHKSKADLGRFYLTGSVRAIILCTLCWAAVPCSSQSVDSAPTREADDHRVADSRPGNRFTLAGELRMIDSRSGKPLSLFEQRNAVVYYQPDSQSLEPAELDVQKMLTWRKDFQPRTLAITVGTTIQFPNNDPILHNVFSVSPGNAFDVGLYAKGEGKSHTFRAPGLVRVYCNVHHEMAAHILVLNTPHYMHPDLDGRFKFDNLAAGSGVVTVWSDRSQPWSQRVTLPLTEPLTIEVEAARRIVPRHLNKFGRPYKRRNSRDDY